MLLDGIEEADPILDDIDEFVLGNKTDFKDLNYPKGEASQLELTDFGLDEFGLSEVLDTSEIDRKHKTVHKTDVVGVNRSRVLRD